VNDWLLRRSRRPDAGHRLYCFPFAGGSPGVYLPWERQLPQVEVWGVLPPGRGKRFEQIPYTRLPELVRALVADVDFVPPYVLFGHSLGALVAYETARALQAAGRPGPVALIASAHRPPHRPYEDSPITCLPDEEFQAEAARRYPVPPELAEDPELLAQSYAMLRSDLEVVENYTFQPGDPLTCPLVVVSGLDDYWSAQTLAGWAQHTVAGCRIEMVPGDHHYVLDAAEPLLAIIEELTAGQRAGAARIPGDESTAVTGAPR
jgi:surfactin synthase thioesterase subunit